MGRRRKLKKPLNRNHTKRPRVDRSSSPNESSPSPASILEGPPKSSSVAESFAASMPAMSLKDSGGGSKGNVASSPSRKSSNNNGSSDGAADIVTSKFDLPSPFTTQEKLEQAIGKSGETNEKSDSNNGSTKSLSDIIPSGSDAVTEVGGGRNVTAISNAQQGSGVPAKSNGEGKSQQLMLTSSPLSDLPFTNGNTELEVVIKLKNPTSNETMVGRTVFMSDFKRMEKFLGDHGRTITSLSSQSQVSSSGYLGDVSSVDNSAGHVQGTSKSSSNSRYAIPRNSMAVSIAKDVSDSPEDLMKRPGKYIPNGDEFSSSLISKSQSPHANSDSGMSTGNKPGVRRRGPSANFPVMPESVPVLSTPPPARSVAKIEGTVAKPQNQFEQEMNDEPVVEAELQKASTEWSTIFPEELVFARWRDRSYYSGMVKSKGLNDDTWIIDFDDGMVNVASESHIVPIRILGVGIKGIYCPDDKYEARSAEVIGQKFGVDPETNRQVVKYAIKLAGDDTPIWCSRRQLTIKEADAKRLRSEYVPATTLKAGEISLDNIVSGSRRRTGGGNESENSISDSKVVAGAFDASSADDNLVLSTPKAKPSLKPGKKTPACGAKNKRMSISTSGTSNPLTNVASPSSPMKEVVDKKETPIETESPAKKKSVIEIGKKKSRKTLFQGIQFFVTASGEDEDDQEVIGTRIVPADPFDKDDIQELIENCGGEIVETIGNETADDVFLITDSYGRDANYIYCMAGSIPCVSHSWIKRCLELNEIVDWSVFILPAGWSLEHQDLIPHHEKKPLKGCKVYVTSCRPWSDQLYNFWKPVLTAAEAIVITNEDDQIIPTGTEVVVTYQQTYDTNDLLLAAGKLNLPVVKPEWLVQTIITGAKAPIDGHDRYKIRHCDTDESEEEVNDESEVSSDGDASVNEDEVSNESEALDGEAPIAVYEATIAVYEAPIAVYEAPITVDELPVDVEEAGDGVEDWTVLTPD